MIAFAEIRAQAWKYGALALAVLAVAACIAVIVFRSSAAVAGLRAAAATHEAQQAVAEAQGLRQALVAEHAKATALNALGTEYEKDREDAQQVPTAVVADLRTGNLKLRKQWAACETSRVSDTATATAERDALAELRAKDQGDLVRVGRDADNQIRALQAVAAEDRK